MAIQWDKTLAVGVKAIDEQHQELFRRVNSLLEGMMQARGKEEVGKLLAFLKEYVVEHFGTEQKYMVQYRYPELVKHKAQHDAFVKTFLQVYSEFEQNGPSPGMAIKVNGFVGSWLREHIGTSDRALGQFLQSNKAVTAAA